MVPKKNKFHIIITKNGKQIDDVYWCGNVDRVNRRFEDMKVQSEKVLFPVIWTHQNKRLVETKYEIFIIKYTDDCAHDIIRLRDEYGKFINYSTNNPYWIIYDKADYNKEEHFWVYGYHPLFERKDFKWVFENLISREKKNKYNFKEILVYNNKLIIATNGNIEIVITKNKKDCIRLYNTIQKMCIEKKMRYIAFCGDICKSKFKSDWINRIVDKTGWDRQKVKRTKTRN